MEEEGFVRCEGPFTYVEARHSVTKAMLQGFQQDWLRRSPEAMSLFTRLGWQGSNQLSLDLLKHGLRMHNLKGKTWKDFATAGLVPAGVNGYDEEPNRWPISQDVAGQLLKATPDMPPVVHDLNAALAFFKLWRKDDEDACSTYLGVACGAKANPAGRDSDVLFRYQPNLANPEAERASRSSVSGIDDAQWTSGEIRKDWETDLASEAVQTLKEWITQRPEDGGYSIHPPQPFNDQTNDVIPKMIFHYGVSGGTFSDICHELQFLRS